MKNFAFDLYGTLIDIHTDENDAAFRTEISEEFFALCGGRCDFWENYAKLCAPPKGDIYYEPDLLQVFIELAKLCGADLGRAQAEEYAYRFRLLSRKKLVLYPEIKNILSGLKARGAKVYLLSNAQACFTVRELEEVSLSKYFDGILLSSDAGVKKPSEKFFNKLIEKYSLERTQTVYTGNDFDADVVGSKSAGLYSAYIDTYGSTPIEKVARLADFITNDFVALKNKLFSLAEEN